MKELPVSLRPRPLCALLAAGHARIRRPADGMYKDLRGGDRLWLREGFYLPRRFNSVSPSEAEAPGVEPTFAVDIAGQNPADLGLGVSRPAHTLPRFWSRHHFIVRGVETQPLDAITTEEAKAEGFSSREAWFAEWDSLVSAVSGRNPTRRAAANPRVLVIDAHLVRHPLDAPRKEPA